MELSDHDLGPVPAENFRVSRAEFAALWAAVEQQAAEQARRHVTDWHTAGVLMTCRWLAHAMVPTGNGAKRLERSPVTERLTRAYPELIEQECLAVERLAMREPLPEWVRARPGWIEAVAATLNWTWRESGQPPL